MCSGGTAAAWLVRGVSDWRQRRGCLGAVAVIRRAKLLSRRCYQVTADQRDNLILDHPERSDNSEDLVSQHRRVAASLWVARRAQGVTLVKCSPKGRNEGAAKRAGTSAECGRVARRAQGNPVAFKTPPGQVGGDSSVAHSRLLILGARRGLANRRHFSGCFFREIAGGLRSANRSCGSAAFDFGGVTRFS